MSNTTDTKKYRLLKDYVTPSFTFKKGTPVCYSGGIYMVGSEAYTERGISELKDWFEEVIEQPKQERIKVGKMSCLEGKPGYGKMKWNLQFKTNKHIHYEKAIDLCNLLERYLNGEMDNPAPRVLNGDTVVEDKGISLIEYYARIGDYVTALTLLKEKYSGKNFELMMEMLSKVEIQEPK